MVALVVLAGCPQRTPPAPPGDPPPAVGGGAGSRAGSGAEDATSDAGGDAVESGARPVSSASGGGESLADTLAPREREPVIRRAGGCQDGARQVSESWQDDCNTCRCGDDGQVRCTELACGGPRGRTR
jgi:hypothetical protein